MALLFFRTFIWKYQENNIVIRRKTSTADISGFFIPWYLILNVKNDSLVIGDSWKLQSHQCNSGGLQCKWTKHWIVCTSQQQSNLVISYSVGWYWGKNTQRLNGWDYKIQLTDHIAIVFKISNLELPNSTTEIYWKDNLQICELGKIIKLLTLCEEFQGYSGQTS